MAVLLSCRLVVSLFNVCCFFGVVVDVVVVLFLLDCSKRMVLTAVSKSLKTYVFGKHGILVWISAGQELFLAAGMNTFFVLLGVNISWKKHEGLGLSESPVPA